MDHAARHALRHEKAPPLLNEIRTHILEMSNTVLPKSAAGQASRYALAIWKKLICCMSPANPMVDGYFRDEIGYFASFSA